MKKSPKRQEAKDKEFTYREALGYALALLARIEQGEVRPDQIRIALVGAPMAVSKPPKAVNPKLLHLYELIAQMAELDQGSIEQLAKDHKQGIPSVH